MTSLAKKISPKNKKRIFKNLFRILQSKKNLKAQDLYKCKRDIEYILDAIADDLRNSKTKATELIASKFWQRGERLIQSYEVEFEIYDCMEKQLVEIFPQCKKEIQSLIQNLKLILENGPELTSEDQKISDRRNFSFYDTTVEVPEFLEKRIDNIILNCPSQEDIDFGFLKLTKNDQSIKDFLTENFFYNDLIHKHTIHMAAVSTAPLVYVVQYLKNPANFAQQQQQIGIHSGAIMNSVILNDFDFSFIGCAPSKPVTGKIIEDWRENSAKKDLI